MQNRKSKLKTLHLLMAIILIFGIIQPGLAFAAGATDDEEEGEEITAEVIEGATEQNELEEERPPVDPEVSPEEVEQATEIEDESTEKEEEGTEKEVLAEEKTEDEPINEEQPATTDVEENSNEETDSDSEESIQDTQKSELDVQPLQTQDIDDIVSEVYLDGNEVSVDNNVTNLVINVTEEDVMLHLINVYDTDGDLVGYLRDDSVNLQSLNPGENRISFSTNYCPSFADPSDCVWHNFDLPEGEYTLDLRILHQDSHVGNLSVGPYIVNPKPNLEVEFNFALNPTSISQWELARSGVEFYLDAPTGLDATLTVGDQSLEFETQEFHQEMVSLDLSPGTYEVEVTIGNTTETEQLVVVNNEEYYGDDSESNPILETEDMVLTKMEAEEKESIVVFADYLHEHTSIDVLINGEHVQTFYHDWGSAYAEIDVRQLSIGEYTIEFVHPTGKGEITLFIVPDDHGAAAPAGTYEGITNQYMAGSMRVDIPTEHPIKFEVDEDGMIKDLEVEYYWLCSYHDVEEGISSSVEMPDTLITVNQPFQINWEEDTSQLSLVGVIYEDGTASGTLFRYSNACGREASEWNLESDTPGPQPVPEDFNVDLEVDTTEETEGPVTISVATTSEVDITSLKWLAGDRTVEEFTGAGNEIDLETSSFTVEENGMYTVYALNTEDVEAVSTIVVDNIVDPKPEVEFSFELRPDRISEWELARVGIDFVLWGPSGQDATLKIGDETLEFEVRFFHEDTIVADLSPGTYDVEVTIGNTTETEQLVVVSNEDYYEDESSYPSLESRHMVLTKSEAEEIETIRVFADDLYENSSIDVFVNDVLIEAFFHDWGGASADIEVSELPIGEHTIAFVHPTGSAEMIVTIVPNEHGAPAPAGTYEGTSIQHIGGSHTLESPFELPIKFEVDENGNIKNLEVEYWWVCVLADGQSGFSTSIKMPDTQITVNQPFQIDWEERASPYSLVGIIHEDGTASGTFYSYSTACGKSVSDWDLVSDTVPDPQPEPEPEDPPTEQEIEFDQTVEVFPGQFIKVKDSSVSIQLPEDLPEETKLTINRVDNDDAAGDVVEVDLQLPQAQENYEGPYVLTLAIDDEFIDKNIAIFYFNEETGEWENIGGEVNKDNKTISVIVNHFSRYGVFVIDDSEDPDDGEPDDGEPGDGEPGDEEPGDEEPGDEEPGDGEPGDGESGDSEPGDDEPGDGEPGDGEPGDEEPGDGEPGDGESGDSEPGDDEPGDGDSSDEETSDVESSDEETSDAEPVDGTESDDNDQTLPSTATNLFNLLLIGGAILLLGFYLMVFRRKQDA